jgi:hypothetical protein
VPLEPEAGRLQGAAQWQLGRRFDAIGRLLDPLFSDPNIYRAADLADLVPWHQR